ncbi:MAG: hypothetical protein ACTSQY_04295 [Candidatus Odinarchaeia archaeon]
MYPHRTIDNYTEELVNLSKRALIEVTTALSAFCDKIVLGGGWAPFFIIEKYGVQVNEHCGSIDIDLILHSDIVKEPHISKIAYLLKINNFKKIPEDPFPFRFIPPTTDKNNNMNTEIHIEFLSEEKEINENSGKNRNQPEIIVSRFRGTDFAFKHNFLHTITAEKRNKQMSMTLRILDPIGSLILKALALESRYKEKDAYDIYMILKYNENLLELNSKLKEISQDPLVVEAVKILKKKFRTRDADGPFFVANFLAPLNSEEKELIKTDVFMRVNQVIRGV